MRLMIAAVGRMKSGPEADLFRDYQRRLARIGRPLGIGPLDLVEIDDRKGGGQAGESVLLTRALMPGALCALDPCGELRASPGLAAWLAAQRDAGRAATCFAIGGADGLDPQLRARADLALSLGPMVWPHLLVRAMLAEQLYRAVTILAGTPYHRG